MSSLLAAIGISVITACFIPHNKASLCINNINWAVIPPYFHTVNDKGFTKAEVNIFSHIIIII